MLSIQGILETYQHLHKPKPHFGMDIHAPSFQAKELVLLENNGGGNSGVPVRCDHYILILCLHGGSIRSVKQKEYTIEAHSLQLLPLGLMHSFIDTDDDAQFYVLLFEKEFLLEHNIDEETLESLLMRFHEDPSPAHLELSSFKRTLFIFEQLNSELREQKSGYKLLCKMLIAQLLFLLQRTREDRSIKTLSSRPQEISSNYLCLIEQNFMHLKDVQSYAKLLDITPKHLSSTIKETLGSSALSFIHSRIIKEIQYLLVYSQKPLKEISQRLHFDNPSQMGRFFKKHVGISAKTYRLQNSNNIDIPTN